MSNNTILTLIAALTVPVLMAPMAFNMTNSYTDCQGALAVAYSTQNIHNGRIDQTALKKMDTACGAMALQAKVYEQVLLPK